jgi:Uma2 family endonuclease
VPHSLKQSTLHTWPMPRLHRYTFDDYLSLEASSTVRHELLMGEIYAMTGGTPQHAAWRLP